MAETPLPAPLPAPLPRTVALWGNFDSGTRAVRMQIVDNSLRSFRLAMVVVTGVSTTAGIPDDGVLRLHFSGGFGNTVLGNVVIPLSGSISSVVFPEALPIHRAGDYFPEHVSAWLERIDGTRPTLTSLGLVFVAN